VRARQLRVHLLSLPAPCPFCEGCWLVAELHAKAADQGWDPVTLPLFPTETGSVLSKLQVLAGIELSASAIGLKLVDISGNRRFGGHSMRVAGARHLAALGFPLLLIQLLGRWGSDIVMRYVMDAPLGAITSTYRSMMAEQELQGTLKRLIQQGSGAEGALPKKAGFAIKALQDELAELRDRLTVCESDPQFVSNTETGVWHCTSVGMPNPPARWRTMCGWRFGLSAARYELARAAPGTDAVWCKSCLRPPVADPEFVDSD
jgi:hypothetical protein